MRGNRQMCDNFKGMMSAAKNRGFIHTALRNTTVHVQRFLSTSNSGDASLARNPVRERMILMQRYVPWKKCNHGSMELHAALSAIVFTGRCKTVSVEMRVILYFPWLIIRVTPHSLPAKATISPRRIDNGFHVDLQGAAIVQSHLALGEELR